MLKNARDGIMRLCFNAKMSSENKRTPCFMVGKMVVQLNKENIGLGVLVKMVTCVVSCLYSKANDVSNSRTESESNPDLDEVVSTQRGNPGRPRNTTHQDMKRKESVKVKLLNDISRIY